MGASYGLVERFVAFVIASEDHPIRFLQVDAVANHRRLGNETCYIARLKGADNSRSLLFVCRSRDLRNRYAGVAQRAFDGVRVSIADGPH